MHMRSNRLRAQEKKKKKQGLKANIINNAYIAAHTLLQHLLAVPKEWPYYLFLQIWKRLKIRAATVSAATRGCRWSNTGVK